MKIAIDANEANVTTRVGTGEYTHQLLTSWRNRGSKHDYSLYLKDAPLSSLPKEASYWHYKQVGPRPAWTRLALPLALARSKHNVFFSPAHYLPPVTSSPSVVTIHDLAYEYFPSLFNKDDRWKLKNWTRRAVKHATHVIAVSDSTKRDLISLYNTPADKISVVHNGYDSTHFNIDNKPQKSLLPAGVKPGEYLLFLGTLQPRKNVIRLVQAFHLLKEGGYKGKLVLAGKIGWMAEETLEVIKASPEHNDIVMTGYIDSNTQQSLYSYADVYVLPSLYEGFGVPVLEAMASGCPVVASDNSSLPEVVGEAGILFNPSDPADLAESVLAIKKKRSSYIKKGLSQVKQFSWDKCAEDTLKIITSHATTKNN